jgi:3-oxoacyl-[acyl-carrier-protein] synthase III
MRILSVHHSVPDTRITNDVVLGAIRARNEHRLDEQEMAAVEQRIEAQLALAGTDVRYIAPDGENVLDHVLGASRRALEDGGVRPDEVDFVIYTGIGRGWLEPASANVVQHALGLTNATGFDLLDACASWIRAVQVAHSFVRGGVYRRGLIVNCECGLSRYADLDVTDLRALDQRVAAFTVGEAATATLVDDGNPDDDFYFVFKNYGEHFRLCMIPLENATAFLPPGMNGEYVPFKFYSLSRKLIATTIKKIVATFEADPRLRDASYDICFGHAASEKAREIIARRLGLPQEMYYRTHARFGNTVSASVPLGMSLALQEGRLQRGNRTLIIVGSAGISIGLASFTF